MCKAVAKLARLTGTAPTSSCRVRLRLRRLLPASSASAGSSLRPGRSAPGPAHPRRTRSSLGRCSCARQSRARSRPWASGRSHPRRARTEPPSRFGLDWRLILAEPPCTSRNGRSCCQRSACSSREGQRPRHSTGMCALTVHTRSQSCRGSAPATEGTSGTARRRSSSGRPGTAHSCRSLPTRTQPCSSRDTLSGWRSTALARLPVGARAPRAPRVRQPGFS